MTVGSANSLEPAGGSDKDQTPRALTMQDLAALAGVAKITVSRALKNSPLVRQPLREQIQQLAKANGYRLNTAARNLRLRRNHAVTVVINLTPSADRSMSDPVFLGLLGGLLQVTTEAKYRLILTTPSELLESRHADSDGIIFLGQGKDEDLLRSVRDLGLPFIVWGDARQSDGDWITIGSDNRHGGELIGSHLTELGRSDILFIGDPAYPEVAARIEGIRSKLPPATKLRVDPCEFGMSDGSETVRIALANGWKGDAVVGASDTIAIGVMNALRSAKIEVPVEMVVIGYDGIEAAAAASIPLTTVEQDWTAAGIALGRAFLDLSERSKTSSARLPVRLVKRQSTDV